MWRQWRGWARGGDGSSCTCRRRLDLPVAAAFTRTIPGQRPHLLSMGQCNCGGGGAAAEEGSRPTTHRLWQNAGAWVLPPPCHCPLPLCAVRLRQRNCTGHRQEQRRLHPLTLSLRPFSDCQLYTLSRELNRTGNATKEALTRLDVVAMAVAVKRRGARAPFVATRAVAVGMRR